MNKTYQTISNRISILLSNPTYEAVFNYSATVIITLAVILFDTYLKFELGLSYSLLLFIFPVILSAYIGSYRAGILSLVILTSSYHFFYIPVSVYASVDNLYQIIPLLIFIAASIFLMYVLHKARNSDEIAGYKKQTYLYSRKLSKETREKEKALAEVKGRDEFLSIASHELKTPLTTSLLQIQIALHNIKNVSLAEFSVQSLMERLENIQSQTDRLSRMISDLSNVSLITTGRMKLELEDVDLVKVINNVITRVSDAERKKDYPITFISPKTLKGQWDSVRVEQILINLLTNAIKYGNNKPISIRLESKNNFAIITVKDQGHGIPKNMSKKIFDRFERGIATNGIKGLGVGLYITKQIVNAHNGHISLKSKMGKGTEFVVKLPRYTESKKVATLISSDQ